MSEPPRVRLAGHLHLVCAAHVERGTFVREQSFSAPLHLSKPYWDGATLLVNVVNQTAGIFGGDGVDVRIAVESGARVLLSSPTAALFHPSHGREAHLEQRFQVDAGASLDVLPEIAIPQGDSRSFQRTTIDLAPGDELIFIESLAPGRVAMGETFAFARYAWATEVRVGGRLAHRERAMLDPPHHGLAGLRALFPAAYHAGIIVVSPGAEKWPSAFAEKVAALSGNQARVAASRLNAHGWSLRILAADSVALRGAIRESRTLIYAQLGRTVPDARRCG